MSFTNETEFNEKALEDYYKAHPELKPKTVRVEYFRMTNPTNKYHAKRTDGFPSKKHAQYAAELQLRQKAGEVWFWLEEVPFKLPGGTKHRVDFMVFYRPTVRDFGRRWEPWELVEVKGRDLAMGRLKRRQVEEIYGVHITVV